jgi:hypothetical protein
MSWRDLKPLPDDFKLERPAVSESGSAGASDSTVRLYFTDALSREWFAEWLRSKHSWTAFTTWVDAPEAAEPAPQTGIDWE